MNQEIIKAFLKKEEVQRAVDESLNELKKQNDITKIKVGENNVVLLNVANFAINDLNEEILDLEDENKVLRDENDEYKKRYGVINENFISSVNYLQLRKSDSSERNKRKEARLLRIAEKLEKGYKEM